MRQVPAQFLTPRLQVLHLGAVVGRLVKWRFGNFFIADRDIEAGAKSLQLLIVQLFLGMGNILALTRLAETIAFNGMSQDNSR